MLIDFQVISCQLTLKQPRGQICPSGISKFILNTWIPNWASVDIWFHDSRLLNAQNFMLFYTLCIFSIVHIITIDFNHNTFFSQTLSTSLQSTDLKYGYRFGCFIYFAKCEFLSLITQTRKKNASRMDETPGRMSAPRTAVPFHLNQKLE